MLIISFILTYTTEPGYVTPQTNENFLEFYQKTRQKSLERAHRYNKKYILKNNDIMKDNNNDKCFDLQCNHCLIKQIYRIIIHCSICKKCIYMKDHHCAWINQCIGQFNIKYYILFLLYLLVASYISLMQCLYVISKNYAKIIIEYGVNKKIYLFIFVFFDIIHVILSIKLLYDQYINLDYYSILNDKNNKIIEIRNKYEILCEYFGEKFRITWFFPFKIGGYYNLIKNKIIINYNKDNKNKFN